MSGESENSDLFPEKIIATPLRSGNWEESESSPETEWEGVYIIKAGKYCKIGKAKDLRQRMSIMQTDNPEELILINFWRVREAFAVESALHHYFRERKHRGEWYKLQGGMVTEMKLLENVTAWLRRKGYHVSK